LAPTFLASALIENKNKRRKIEIEKKRRLIQPVLDLLACLFFFFSVLVSLPANRNAHHTTFRILFISPTAPG
jgi:hypothetical protein